MIKKRVCVHFLIVFLALVAFSSKATPRMEGRFIQLQNTYTTPVWTQVNFQQRYDSPPAVFMLSTSQGSNPAIIRIRNVTETGFEALPLEPTGEDGRHITMGAYYFAVAKGEHTFDDGTVMEVGSFDTNAVQYGITNFGNGRDYTVPRSWFDLTFTTTSFTQTPTFFHSLQTLNNLDSNVPTQALRPYFTVAAQNLSQTGIQLALEASETRRGDGAILDETIAYMVVEPGSNRTFTANNNVLVTWETLFTGTRIMGWDDGCVDTNFNNNYTTSPLVAASKVTRNGEDGGWLRSCRLDANRLGLRVDEDRDNDSEREHTPENASIFAMDQASFVYSDFPSCDAMFPGAVATYTDASIVNSSVGTIELNRNVKLFDSNNQDITTANLISTTQTPLPTCNGASCVATGQNAISTDSALLIPSITNDGSDTLPAPSNSSPNVTWQGEYKIKSNQVRVVNGTVNVTAPTRIFIESQSGAPPSFEIVNSTINVSANAYLAIYVDGTVTLAASNSAGFIFATGQITVGSGVSHIGRLTSGTYIDVESFANDITTIDATQGAALPNFIDGVCGEPVNDAIDHYRFELTSSQGLTCEPSEFTIKACANADCSTLYTQTAELDLTPDNSGQYTWAPAETITFNQQLIVGLSKRTSGNSAPIGFNSATPSAPLQCFINGQFQTGDCRINYRNTGFRIRDVNNNDLKDHTAAAPYTAYLQAVRTDNDTGACESIFAGSGDVKFSRNFITPSSNAAPSEPLVINGETITTNTDVFVTFDPNNDYKAPLTVNYSEAGRYSFDASLTVDTGATLTGNSGNIVSVPAVFQIELEDSHTTTDDSYAIDANDSIFKQAGEDFDFTVTALNADNQRTHNFNKSGINVVASLQAPTTGAGGAVGNFEPQQLNLTDGERITTATYDEVGIVSLTVDMIRSDYLNYSGPNAGQSILGSMSDIGRFIPAQITMIANATEPACGDNNTSTSSQNTYYGQEFKEISYTLEAQNLTGDKVENYIYDADPLKNFAPSKVINYIINDDTNNFVAASVLAPRYSIAQSQWNKGEYRISDTNAILARPADAALVTDGLPSPLLELRPLVKLDNESGFSDLSSLNLDYNYKTDQSQTVNDSWGVTNTFEVRFGRLRLSENFGSEFEPLQIPLQVEYWNGSDFVINRHDSCTGFNFNASDFSLTNEASGQQASKTGSSNKFISGVYPVGEGWYLSASGDKREVTVVIDNVADFLQYDWNADGTFTNDPIGVLKFGRFRGSGRVIYWREN